METPDASRSDDNDGTYKRRISSILKAPRASMKCTDPEQEERQVDSVKPAKKRMSRKVSFATSNNVLLFPTDLKNGSPVRSPLQINTEVAAEQISIQTSSIDGAQPITGMETLLNAPLHDLQQRKKEYIMFNQDDFGEKTMVFTGEDTALMDMTHSNTILISNDSDCSVFPPQRSNALISTYGNMDFSFSKDKCESGYSYDSTENCAPLKNVSTSSKRIDPEFEHFLASLSNSSGPKVNEVPTKSVKSQKCASPSVKTDHRLALAAFNARRSVDVKENQDPALSTTQRARSVKSVMPQMPGPLFLNTSMIHTEQDDMALTKSHTVLIDDNRVFRCVPSVRSNEKQHLGSTFSPLSFSTDPDEMELTRSQTVAIDSQAIGMIAQNPSLRMERSTVFTSDPNKTQIFTDEDHGMEMTTPLNASLQEKTSERWESASAYTDDMEITKSLTAVIDLKSCNKLMHSFSKPNTKAHHGLSFVQPVIGLGNVSDAHVMGSLQHQGKGRSVPEALLDLEDMEITRSQTVAIDTKALNVVNHMQNPKRTSISLTPAFRRASHTPEHDCGLEMGQSLAVSSDHRKDHNLTDETMGKLFPMTNPRGERFEKSLVSAELGTDDMEITRSQTGIIDTHVVVANPAIHFSRGSVASVLDVNKTLLGEDENGMEMTQALTAQIVANVSSSIHAEDMSARMPTVQMSTFQGEKDNYFVKMVHETDSHLFLDSDDMDMTSQTAVIESDNIKTVNSVSKISTTVPHLQPIANIEAFPFGTGHLCTSVLPDSDTEMEMTKSQTVAIETKGIGMTFLHQTNATLRQAHANESRLVEVAHCRNTPVAVNLNLEEAVTTITNETQIFSEDHEMERTQAVTMQIEQHAPINEEDVKGPSSTTNSISLPLSEAEVGGNSPNRTERFELTASEDVNNPDLKVEERFLIPNKSENSEDDHLPLDMANTEQITLTNLQHKLDHMSHTINISAEVRENCTPPLSDLTRTSSKHSLETEPLTAIDSGSKSVQLVTEKTACVELEDHIISNSKRYMTPLKSLTSRVSFGGFLPKLPQRPKPSETNHTESKSLKDFGNLAMKNSCLGGTPELTSNTMMDNIDDEVLPEISCEEDLTENVNTGPLQTANKEGNTFCEEVVEDVLVQENFEEPVLTVPKSQKRPLPEEGHQNTTEEKRWKTSTDHVREMVPPKQVVQCDSSCTEPSVDSFSSNSHIRCEGTLESSTCRQSQLESQFDVRTKLQDGSITVKEFLKLFSIDFVIYKPRQSILPARMASELDREAADLLMEKHIHRPKQRVYETDCQMLTEMMDRLKLRLRDQDNLLKSVNQKLWEAVKSFSEEELLLFGSKLKERRTFFRKKSKVQFHEMKSNLYFNLVKTTQEAQHNLRGKIEEADSMLKDIDKCLHDLEAELEVVEGNGLDDCGPSLKARQQGLENVNKAIAENERQMCEMELQKITTVNKVDKLQKETQELENHMDMLDRVNEWRFEEKDEQKTVYSFLYQSFLLEIQFEASDEEITEDGERKIKDITFQHQMDDEKSQDSARLVHILLGQYVGSETNWLKNYPTSRYIPKLLHDVGLVVSRCRLLGEEIYLMKKWGSLRLDILDISCVDTKVCILFSSLKAFAKFEITLAITSSYPFCLLQVQNFQNHIGNTTKEQLEGIISSITPAKNYLTKIVKKIHGSLLC
ncbi:hypothetical protein UPYG_G00253620 [Umbra pygmaea]|uniref:Knl1 C-terminal RWD domain-containing protein n=1 Tax=Umbra pygmaea TaxID=75934 RepID=A0ABD0W827_UMBPY